MKRWKWKGLPILAAMAAVLTFGKLEASAAGVRDIFDAKYYADSYADVKAAFGDNEEAMFAHYMSSGLAEGRLGSPVFNVALYRKGYADLEAIFGDDWDAYVNHYLTVGQAEGRTIGVNPSVNPQTLVQPVSQAQQMASAQDGAAYQAMIALKAQYPEGTPWTNDNFYAWHGGIYSGGYGCAGFAFLLSDAAFGLAPARVHQDFGSVRVGDIVRMNGDTHSVIILEVRDDSVIVAEGNFENSVHWGREIPKQELAAGDNVMTRY